MTILLLGKHLYSGRLLSLSVATNATGTSCGSPRTVDISWTKNGALTDDYQLKLYIKANYDGAGYGVYSLEHTENSPASTLSKTNFALDEYPGAAGPAAYTFKAEIYDPQGLLVQSIEATEYSFTANLTCPHSW